MNVKILFFIIINIFFISSVNAASIAGDILLTGSVAENTSGAGYGGKLIFPYDSTNSVKITPVNSTLNSDLTVDGDLDITGDFWLSNLSSSTDSSLGWCTFDIGTVSGASEVILENNDDNTFTFSGYAWCEAAGWIYFSDSNLISGVDNTKVVYDRGTEKVNGCAWSRNLGWICIEDFSLDTTPPDLTSTDWQNFAKPFAANHAKDLTTPEPISKVDVTNWNSTAKSSYPTDNFTHDFRAVKPGKYEFIVTDPTGNTSDTGKIQVVAGVPSESLNSDNIGGGATASTFYSTLSENKIADGNEVHTINFTLKDTYGNIIKDESLIKDVEVEVSFDNNVDTDQVSNIGLGDAISYINNDFSLISGLISNTGIGYNATANYNIDIKSKAPTSEGYTFTTDNNDIKLSDLKINITALDNAGVGETTNLNPFLVRYQNKKFKFTPAVKVGDISNNTFNRFIRDQETIFTGSINLIKTSGLPDISDLEIQHKLDIMSGSTNVNHRMSFQDISNVNGTQECIGNVVPNEDNTSYSYNSTNPDCDLSLLNSTSNILKKYPGPYTTSINIFDSFKTTPKIVLSTMPKFDVKYSSEISYKLGSTPIKYNSLETNYSDSAINNEIKIAGISHKSSNNFAVVDSSSINYVGKINKMDIYKQIKKNIADYQRIGVGTYGNTVYYNTDHQTISSWPANVDTIIVDGVDIVIEGDIYKESGKQKVIIALKDSDGNKGNIWIKNGVQFIAATLVTDRSILSGDGTNYYSDNGSAKNQLFIKGSILSFNTIGGASQTTPKCPFYITSGCDLTEAKRYDLNHMRGFVSDDGTGGSIGTKVDGTIYLVDMTKDGYANAPIIVEYDPDIQLNTPEILLIR